MVVLTSFYTLAPIKSISTWCSVGLSPNLLTLHPTHPMVLQPKMGLDLHYLLPPQCSIISDQLPIATTQKSGSILLHHIFPSSTGFSNLSYSSKLSFKHFLRNSCAFHPLDISHPLKPFQFDTCYRDTFTI
jgi:hypothetical protein